MLILGIETSCDDTSAAIVEDGKWVLSNVTQSSARDFTDLGGVIPEKAARRQFECILPVVEGGVRQAGVGWDAIDAIAVTKGPGLIGSLLVGTATARVLARVLRKPLIGVHHTLGHLHSTFLVEKPEARSSPFRPSPRPRDSDPRGGPSRSEPDGSSEPMAGPCGKMETKRNSTSVSNFGFRLPAGKAGIPDVPTFPILTLSVSGGHTELWYRTDFLRGKLLGQTLDDAAGEAFDKGAVLFSLPFPGGPALSKLAEGGNPKSYEFPLPLGKQPGLDFSFSGLKTALKYLLRDLRKLETVSDFVFRASDLAASYQEALCAHLLDRVRRALKQYRDLREVHLVGGVSANKRLRAMLEELLRSKYPRTRFRTPIRFEYCTDNAAMIAGAAAVLWKELKRKATADFETSPTIGLTEIRE